MLLLLDQSEERNISMDSKSYMYIYLTTYMYMFVFITKCKLLKHDYTMVSALVSILVWISIAVTKHHEQK